MAHTFVAPETAKKAKRADGRRDKRMTEYDNLMLEVVKNAPQILRLEPEGGETARAIRLRAAQAINRVEKAGQIKGGTLSGWTGEDGAVYVQFVAEKPAQNGTSTGAAETPAATAPKTTPVTAKR